MESVVLVPFVPAVDVPWPSLLFLSVPLPLALRRAGGGGGGRGQWPMLCCGEGDPGAQECARPITVCLRYIGPPMSRCSGPVCVRKRRDGTVLPSVCMCRCVVLKVEFGRSKGFRRPVPFFCFVARAQHPCPRRLCAATRPSSRDPHSVDIKVLAFPRGEPFAGRRHACNTQHGPVNRRARRPVSPIYPSESHAQLQLSTCLQASCRATGA